MDRIKKFRWWYLLILLPLLMLAGFLVWALTPLGPMPEAMQALKSSADVIVETEDWYVFMSRDTIPDTGLILYPGGRVDPRSYTPVAHALSAEGYHVVIVPMPLNLAVLGVNKAEEVIAAYPEIKTWVVGGHSLGGSMAANYVKANPGIIDGLVLWASYPATSDDLSMVDVSVTSISATHDGLATSEDIAASKPFLPADTTWVIINGGNHAQFGWYGEQSGDNEAEITREEQQEHIIRATLDLLEDVNAGN
jgi:hypothetical protein